MLASFNPSSLNEISLIIIIISTSFACCTRIHLLDTADKIHTMITEVVFLDERLRLAELRLYHLRKHAS